MLLFSVIGALLLSTHALGGAINGGDSPVSLTYRSHNENLKFPALRNDNDACLGVLQDDCKMKDIYLTLKAPIVATADSVNTVSASANMMKMCLLFTLWYVVIELASAVFTQSNYILHYPGTGSTLVTMCTMLT